jgi:anti-sigma regulatory factor (Ser/Thr protein kinase)/predicted small metal-binding protein
LVGVVSGGSKRDDHSILWRRPVKRFVCAELHPDCDRAFTGPTDQAVLDQVLAHAAADHGLPCPSMAFIETVVIATHPLDGEERCRLTLVGAAPPDRSGRITGAGHRAGRQGRPIRRSGYGATGEAGTLTALTGRHTRAHRAYRHECWLYGGDTEFVAAMLPFIRDGLAGEQPVMVAVPQPRLHALRDALGGDATQVAWADMADLGANPARIIPAWQEFTRGDRRPVRGIGQPIWAGRGHAELVEAQFHEALLNLAVAPDTPLWLLCPYDTSTLPDDVIDEALRSHPVLAEAGAYRGSTDYGGAHHADFLFGGRLPEPAAPTTVIGFDPARHRHVDQLIRAAAAEGVTVDRAAKLATATDEIATAAHHDSGEVEIRLWHEDAAVLCEVTDATVIDNPMIGRSAKPTIGSLADRRDRAIRLANELCDLVQVRSGRDGTTVRIHTRRSPQPTRGRGPARNETTP